MYAEFPIDRRVGGLLKPFFGGLSFDFFMCSYFYPVARFSGFYKCLVSCCVSYF